MTRPFDEISDLEPCPDDEVLRSWAEGSVADPALHSILGCHVELCEYCHRKLAEFRRQGSGERDCLAQHAQELLSRAAELKDGKAAGPIPGSLWRTSAASEIDSVGPLVIVIDGPNETPDSLVRVAEVSEDISRAIQTDMVLEPPESGLRFRCMVRAGNVFHTSPAKMVTFAGRLSPGVTERVIEFCRVAETVDESIPLSQYVFVKDPQGTELMVRRGVISGMLVTSDDDPRIKYLHESKRKVAHLVARKAAASEKVGAKVIDIRSRRFITPLVALAAALVGVVVTWQVSQILYEKSLAELKAENAAKVASEAQQKRKYEELLTLKGISEKELTIALKELKALRDRFALKRRVSPNRSEILASELPPPYLDSKTEQTIIQAIKSHDVLALKRGLDKNPSYSESFAQDTGDRPLHWASEEGYLPIVQLLVQHGADVNSMNHSQKTPLMLAAEKGHLDVVAFLLRRGADKDLRDKNGKSAEDLARARSHFDVVDLLKSGP